MPSAESFADQLVAVFIRFVASDFKIVVEALDRFLKSYPMSEQFVAFKIILKIAGFKF